MTATGIKASALIGQAGSYVSVTVNQVSVSNGQSVSGAFSKKLEAASAAITDRTQNRAISETNTTEYSKEQPKTNAEKANEAVNSAETEGKAVRKAPETEAQGIEKTDSKVQNEQVDTDCEQGTVTEDKPEDFTEVLEILNTLLQGISQILETTVNELKEGLEKLNIQPSQLTDSPKLAGLVLDFNGAQDMSELLVNNDMLKTFEEVKELVQSVLEDFGIEAEEFVSLTSTETAVEILSSPELVTEEGLYKLDTFTKQNPDITLEDAEVDTGDAAPQVEIVKVVSQTGENTSSKNSSDGENSENSDKLSQEPVKKAKAESTSVDRELTPAEHFVRNLETAFDTSRVELPEAEVNISFREILNQLTDAIKVEISPDNTSLEMNLHPESLGRVSLNITSKDGVMTAQIATENQVSKEALESQLQILKENIEAQGIKVEAIEVTVSSFMFSDSKNAESEDSQNGGSHRRNHGIELEDALGTTGETENLLEEVILQTGSTVTYTA